MHSAMESTTNCGSEVKTWGNRDRLVLELICEVCLMFAPWRVHMLLAWVWLPPNSVQTKVYRNPFPILIYGSNMLKS